MDTSSVPIGPKELRSLRGSKMSLDIQITHKSITFWSTSFSKKFCRNDNPMSVEQQQCKHSCTPSASIPALPVQTFLHSQCKHSCTPSANIPALPVQTFLHSQCKHSCTPSATMHALMHSPQRMGLDNNWTTIGQL